MESWSPLPVVGTIMDAAEDFRYHANRVDPAGAFSDLCELAVPLARLAHSDALAQSMVFHLQRIREDPGFISPLWGEQSILMLSDKHWQLRLGLYTRASDHIYSFPFHFACAVVPSQTESLRVRLYDLPTAYCSDVFQPGVEAVGPTDRELSGGEVLILDSRRQALDVDVRQPVAALKFIMKPFMTLQWMFDRSTRKATQAIASNPLESELVTICLTLKAMKLRASTPTLQRLARHSSHFVRWSAIQALGTVEPDAAIDALRTAIGDPHPHIRAAADKQLAALNLH